MSEIPPSIISHVSLGTNDYEKALAFYDKTLAALGIERKLHLEEYKATSYGRAFPEFWIQAPYDRKPASVGNGTHVAFLALSKEQVNTFHETALAAGGIDDGKPGPRPEYGPEYYGAFVRDLDGNKIEAMFWDTAASKG